MELATSSSSQMMKGCRQKHRVISSHLNHLIHLVPLDVFLHHLPSLGATCSGPGCGVACEAIFCRCRSAGRCGCLPAQRGGGQPGTTIFSPHLVSSSSPAVISWKSPVMPTQMSWHWTSRRALPVIAQWRGCRQGKYTAGSRCHNWRRIRELLQSAGTQGWEASSPADRETAGSFRPVPVTAPSCAGRAGPAR